MVLVDPGGWGLGGTFPLFIVVHVNVPYVFLVCPPFAVYLPFFKTLDQPPPPPPPEHGLRHDTYMGHGSGSTIFARPNHEDLHFEKVYMGDYSFTKWPQNNLKDLWCEVGTDTDHPEHYCSHFRQNRKKGFKLLKVLFVWYVTFFMT